MKQKSILSNGATREKLEVRKNTMGRQENIEIFEDTFALCKRNSTLRDAIEQSAKKQKLYPKGVECTEKHLCSACQNHRESQAHTGSSNALRLCRKESLHPQLCFCGKSGRWCDERFFGTGRGNLPLLHTVSESQRRNPLEGVLCAPPPPAEPTAQ